MSGASSERVIPARWLLIGGLSLVLVGLALPLVVVARLGQGADAELEPLDLRQPLRPEMVVLPPGEFWMGSPVDEPGRDSDEHRHRVRIGEPGSRTFAIGRTEVTQAQWQAVMGGNPSYFRGPDRPVERVTWYAALMYLNRLSAREGLGPCYALSACSGDPNDGGDGLFDIDADGAFVCEGAERVDDDCDGYRLPSEAEWEYAARAGTEAATYAGPIRIVGQNDAPVLDPIAWYGGNSAVSDGGDDCSGWPEKQHPDIQRCGTQPVSLGFDGGKASSPWKLHDMLGNVWEWVEDAYEEDIRDHQGDAPVVQNNPRVRVNRGCGWNSNARYCRAAYRDRDHPANRFGRIGLRPARTWPLVP